MLLNELNMKALCVSAESVLPVKKSINVEGHETEFFITSFCSGYGSGKKTVISGTISLHDANNTSTEMNHSDIETIRRKVSKLLGLKNTSDRKPRAVKEQTEVNKLRQSLAVARRLPHQWCKIDVVTLRAFFKEAREADRKNAKEALKARAVAPILEKVAKLSDEERALLLSSLQ